MKYGYTRCRNGMCEGRKSLGHMCKSVKRRRCAKKMEKGNYSINCKEKTSKTSEKEHRSIKLMPTMCKIYDVHGETEKEVRRKENLPESQTGFRNGGRMADNLYMLRNYFCLLASFSLNF